MPPNAADLAAQPRRRFLDPSHATLKDVASKKKINFLAGAERQKA